MLDTFAMYQPVVQKTSLTELIGPCVLGAADRAVLNLLYQHAHDSGRLGEAGVEWEIPMAALRLSKREGNDKLVDCLKRLMRVVVQVYFPNGRLVITPLFDFFDLPADEGMSRAVVRFGIPKKLSRNVIEIDNERT